LNAKSETASTHAARIHEGYLRNLEQLLNYFFRFASVHNLGIDHVVICIISAEDAANAKICRIFRSGAVPFARLSMNEDRASLRVRMTRGNRSVGKQNDTLARLCPTQTMPARITNRRIHFDDGVPCVVVQHLFRISCSRSIVLHGSLIEKLFEVGELKQKRNGRRVTDEMKGIDLAGDLCISLKLTGRPALSEFDYTGIVTSQKDV